jgi:hypothetical protein
MKKTRKKATPEASSGATTIPMAPQEEIEADGGNPFEVGHKRGRTQDSVYTRFLRDTASSSIKPGARLGRGSKD